MALDVISLTVNNDKAAKSAVQDQTMRKSYTIFFILLKQCFYLQSPKFHEFTRSFLGNSWLWLRFEGTTTTAPETSYSKTGTSGSSDSKFVALLCSRRKFYVHSNLETAHDTVPKSNPVSTLCTLSFENINNKIKFCFK